MSKKNSQKENNGRTMEKNDQEINDIQEQEQELASEEAKAAAEEQGTNPEAEVNEFDKLKAEVDEAKEKYLRLYSEFENYRRRTSRERLDLINTANEELMSAILPVIDDFERADKAFDENGDIRSFKEGYDLIYNKLKKNMEAKGLKLMECRAGDDFNAEIHEAVTQIPAPEDNLKGKIVDVIEKGYFLNEKVIRFAKVVTGS